MQPNFYFYRAYFSVWTKMSKQKSINQFFKPLATKRPADVNNENMPEKRSKNCDLVENNPANAALQNLCKDLKILDPNMGDTWFNALQKEFTKPYFKKLDEFVTLQRQTYKIYPEHQDVWSWTKHCRLDQVKVVIIGQDPYHNPRQAHGLCFSVQKGVKPPPSLVNMYKELTTDIEGFKPPGHGDLTEWARQGVLLLNACLTVRENNPNSHADKGWENITDAVIKAISEKNKGVVFLLWGAFAQKKAACVDKKKHHLLKTVHPSPLSATRGFFGCKHFSQCNKLLVDAGKTPIDWKLS